MGKYKKLLIAFDGSESSKNALKQAIKLAETEKSWIKVVAVVPSYEGDLELVGVRNIKEVLKGPAEKLLAEAIEISKAERAAIITNLEQGEAYERIVDVADAENCDLIVMGKSGIHNLETTLMGGVTARVIGHSNKDVLVIPLNTVLNWDHIVLATDGSRNSEVASDHAINFAKSYNAHITVISVVDVNEEFYAQAPEAVDKMIQKSKSLVTDVKVRAETSGVSAQTRVAEGEAYRKIVDLARETGAGIIFIGSHGRTGIRRLLMGRVTEKVIGGSPCPVLVVKS